MHWTIYSFFTDIATIRRQREMALPLPRKREVPVTKVKLLRSRMIRKRSRPVLKPSEGGDPFAQVNPKKDGAKRPLGLPICLSYCLSFQAMFGIPMVANGVDQKPQSTLLVLLYHILSQLASPATFPVSLSRLAQLRDDVWG